jgi:hypothetical protein
MLKVHKKITENEYLPDFKGSYAASALPLNPPVNLIVVSFILNQLPKVFFSALGIHWRVQSTKSGICLKQVLSDENRSLA